MSEGWYRASVAVGRAILRALDVTVRAEGQERVPTTGPVVLAANHVSYPDFMFITRTLLGTRPWVRYMCRHDVWNSPARWPMNGARQIPVDRQAPAGAYLTARRLLDEGEIVCVFPEGGISPALTVRALMPGAVALARETGAPLVPVSLWGGQRLWPQRRHPDLPLPWPDLHRGRLVDVRFRESVEVAPDADVTAVTRDLGHRLWRGLEELQLLSEHRPRPGECAPWYPAHLGGHAVPRPESLATDRMPRSAVPPTWGPDL